jgi:hypothetical protein
MHTVGELRRLASKAKHNLPDLSIMGPHTNVGIHHGVFRYGDDKILKVSKYGCIKRMKKILPLLRKGHKHLAKLLDFGTYNTGHWELIEYIPLTISAQEADEYLGIVERAALFKRYKKMYHNYAIDAVKVRKLPPQWQSLYKFLSSSKLWYDDLHAGNVRKTADGTVKLIDFESFQKDFWK